MPCWLWISGPDGADGNTAMDAVDGDDGLDGSGNLGFTWRTACPDDETFFQDTLYDEVLGLKCAGCQNPSGLAANTAFVLEPPETEGADELNFVMMTALVDLTLQNVPVLLLRPSGQHPDGHTGGTPTPVGTSDYEILLEWVDRASGLEDPCAAQQEDCSTVAPGPPVLRRLTRAEYDRTVQSLLGIDSTYGAGYS